MTDLWSELDEAHEGAPSSDGALVEARRELSLFGLPFELVWIPSRGTRAGIPGARAAFVPNRGPRIRREEAFWNDGRVCATPNRFPFFWRQLLLWPAAGEPREVDAGFLAACLAVADAAGGTVLVNTIGASASIPMAHAHLIEAPSRVMSRLPLSAVTADGDVRILATAPDTVPFFVAAVEGGSLDRRAERARRLMDVRATAAVNLVADAERVWIVPRRSEVPAPWFPWALGAGELFGRFVYPERGPFEAATPADLERALVESTVPATDEEVDGLRRALGG